MTIKKIFIFSFVFLLSGCASGTKFSELPIDQTQMDSGQAQMVFYRTQILGAAVQPTIYVDGQPTGKCTSKGVFLVDVVPGTHHVIASTETDSNVHVDVEPSNRTYIRCSIGIGLFIGRPKLEVVSGSTGKSESDTLSFTGKY